MKWSVVATLSLLIAGAPHFAYGLLTSETGKSKLKSVVSRMTVVNRLTQGTTLKWKVTQYIGVHATGIDVGAYKFKPEKGDSVPVAIATFRDGAPNIVNLELRSATKLTNPTCTVDVRQASAADGSLSQAAAVQGVETEVVTAPRGVQTALNVKVPLAGILGALHVPPNRALVGASVTCSEPGGQNVSRATVAMTAEGLLHIVRRRYVLVLPGIFGSSIDVNAPGSFSVANWPWGALRTGDNITPLQCNNMGVPENPANKIRVVTQAYDSEAAYAGLEGDFPVIQATLDRTPKGRFWHHPVSFVPYDWRRKAVRVIEDLLHDDDTLSQGDEQQLLDRSFPELTRTPSLKAMKRVFQTADRMMDDKFAIIGHSTGGLVVNGLVRATRQTLNGQQVAVATNLPDPGDNEHGPLALVTPGDYVANAFTAGAPFAGSFAALKGYFDGEMGWSGLKDKILAFAGSYAAFQQISPTLPIIYTLSPTNQGRNTTNNANPLASIKASNGTVTQYNNLREFFTALRNLIGQNAVTMPQQLAVRWNDNRFLESEAFHGFCRREAAAVPVTAFFTVLSDPQSTVSGALYDATARSVTYSQGDGDKTVPRGSLTLTQAGVTGVKLKADVGHGAIVKEQELWKEAGERINAYP
jgi:hypothetical protein